jgi:hypothetical protein
MQKHSPQRFKVSPQEAKALVEFIDSVVDRYVGPADELESAIGMVLLGRHLGWKALYIIHSKRTVAKYEEILGLKVRDSFAPEGASAQRSRGLSIALQHSNFWKVVSGELSIDRDDRKFVEKKGT